MRKLTGTVVCLVAAGATAWAQPHSLPQKAFRCDEANSGFCPDRAKNVNYEGQYLGHDEPSVLFYSNVPGAGNSNVWRLTLPTDPPARPNQAGTGGVWNFQLHPTFWLGMAMCDTESSPEFTKVCRPDTDANIFDNPDPTAPDFIGHHPGAAFMELQFYPPGWVTGADATRYAVAITVTSFNASDATGQDNNQACLDLIGDEPQNFAFVQRNGVPAGPPGPLDQTGDTFTPNAQTLFMNPGDDLVVSMHDTEAGFRVDVRDLTTGQSGFMVASRGNGFTQVIFDPTAKSCTSRRYAFHPMYSTSNEHTRVTWAAHSYNVAFSDEIGHFEFCNAVDPATLNCTVPGVGERKLDVDDTLCFTADQSPLIPVTGCFGSDVDFDGTSYQFAWPGTFSNSGHDQFVHPAPVRFSSPMFPTRSGLQNYSRVAFEANLPAIEVATTPACNHLTGANCVNPPKGARFYPFFSTTGGDNGACRWQLGGAHIPGTDNLFGGSSAAEFGTVPLPLVYPNVGFTSIVLFEDFRHTLSANPCPASSAGLSGTSDN